MKKSIIIGAVIAAAAGVIALASGTIGAADPNVHKGSTNTYVEHLSENGARKMGGW